MQKRSNTIGKVVVRAWRLSPGFLVDNFSILLYNINVKKKGGARMIGRQKENLERLYLTYIYQHSIAKTMRENLASDIVVGYSLSNVVKQMVKIEEYESTVVRAAEEEYNTYKSLFDPFEIRKYELIFQKINSRII